MNLSGRDCTQSSLAWKLRWCGVFTYPLMAVVQEISARVGRTTGLGIAGNMRKHYPPWLLRTLVFFCASRTPSRRHDDDRQSDQILQVHADVRVQPDAMKPSGERLDVFGSLRCWPEK